MDWTAFRSHFPVTQHWAFFDHAAVSPIPDTAIVAMNDYAHRIAVNGLADVWHWVDRCAQVRKLAAQLINSPSVDDVFFVPNTTTGIGLIAEGYPWKPGENVVLASEEYPSNQYPWMNLASRGVEVRKVPTRGNRIELDDVRAAITDKTRVLSTSFVQFGSGFRQDLDALGALCREHDLFFFVDAIQGLGAFPLDVQKTPIDALAADGHKWMLAPEGAGIAYIRREWIDRLHPIGVGSHSVVNQFEYSTINLQFKPHAGRYEGGAANLPGITALGASLELLLNAGIENVSQRILQLTDYLCEQAPSAGAEVYSSRLDGDRSGIVSLSKPGVDPKVIQKRCRDAGVIVNMRAGRVRVSPHAYNTEAELDQLLNVLHGTTP